jgi:hypothetical protein
VTIRILLHLLAVEG